MADDNSETSCDNSESENRIGRLQYFENNRNGTMEKNQQ